MRQLSRVEAGARAAQMEQIRQDFPLLGRSNADGRRLIYFDSAATSLVPLAVTDAMVQFYHTSRAAADRGSHRLSDAATMRFAAARQALKSFFGAGNDYELIFTRNTTEALNLAASGYAEQAIGPGDSILISPLEHHSNYLPWRSLAERRGGTLRIAELTSAGTIDLPSLERCLARWRPKIVAVTHVSNVTGQTVPVRQIAQLAHSVGATIVVDAAQSAPHLPLETAASGIDLLAVSSHKMLGPSGIGALLVRKALIDRMRPAAVGGGTVYRITEDAVSYKEGHQRFEAGTQDVPGAVGWAAASEYLMRLGWDVISAHQQRLTELLYRELRRHPHIRIVGPVEAADNQGLVSFVVDGIHPHDVGAYLDGCGIAVRVGNLCCQPLLRRLGLIAVSRVSLYIYNNEWEIEQFGREIGEMLTFFDRFRAQTSAPAGAAARIESLARGLPAN